jgi:hypothetical protein
MTKRIGAATTAALFSAATLLAVLYGGSASARSAFAVSAARQAQTEDIGARRHHGHDDVHRSAYTSYYGRPYCYAPAPFSRFRRSLDMAWSRIEVASRSSAFVVRCGMVPSANNMTICALHFGARTHGQFSEQPRIAQCAKCRLPFIHVGFTSLSLV